LGGKLRFESCSATWNFSTDGAFALEKRKTTGNEVYLRIQVVVNIRRLGYKNQSVSAV
jgi:hypothetical protein